MQRARPHLNRLTRHPMVLPPIGLGLEFSGGGDFPCRESRVEFSGIFLGLGVIEFEVGYDEFGFVEVFLRELVEGLRSKCLEVARNGRCFAALDKPDVVLVVAGLGGSLTEGVELADSLLLCVGEDDSVYDDDSFFHGVISLCFSYKYT